MHDYKEIEAVICGFPITPETGLKSRETFEDVIYEIINHNRYKYEFTPEFTKYAGPGTWCYYVAVSEDMLPQGLFEEFWLPPTMLEREGRRPQATYAYSEAKFSQVDWHGGATWYEKLGGIDGAARQVRIGCDFAHSWDQGHEYDYAAVEREAIETVKQLKKIYPFYRRCPYNGSWKPADQMVERIGKLYAPESIAAMDAPKS